MDWLLNTEFGQIILLAATLIVARIIIKSFLDAVIRRAIKVHSFENQQSEKKREATLKNIIGTTLTLILWVIGVVGLLAILHVNIAGLLTGAGLIGLIIGWGAQGIMKDFFGGLFILIENQYRVGDIVTIGLVTGTVEKITLRITKLRDIDGNLHTIPNGSIIVTTNKTFGWSNVNIDLNVSYGLDTEKLKKIIDDTGASMTEDEKWKTVILKPIKFVRIENLGDSNVTIKMLGKVVSGKQWDIAGEFRARLKAAFSKHGIEVPATAPGSKPTGTKNK